MEPKVPRSIKERVIKQWLQGTSRDQIAEDNDIGTGTVSAIIKDAKHKDIPDIDLLREVALVRKNEDLDVVVLADSIRLKKKLDDMDLNEDQIESFIENINVHCFKRGLKAEEFVDTINKIVTEPCNASRTAAPLYYTRKVRNGKSKKRNRRCNSKTTSGIATLQCNHGRP
jgi:hypothetical protein